MDNDQMSDIFWTRRDKIVLSVRYNEIKVQKYKNTNTGRFPAREVMAGGGKPNLWFVFVQLLSPAHQVQVSDRPFQIF